MVRFFQWFIVLCLSISSLFSIELDVRGQFGLEWHQSFQSPIDPRSEDYDVSLFAKPEVYYDFEDRNTLAFSPYLRLQWHDEERNHFDVREFYWEYSADDWILKAGLGQVYWGVTEFVHLVNVINQTDLVENIDGEDKLGQPMLEISYFLGDGQLDLYVLPVFRERTFPGEKGRLRSPWVVDTDRAQYESSRNEKHVDFAFRYATMVQDVEFGLSCFHGTRREPNLIPDSSSQTLVPYYSQTSQLGFDGLYIWEDWLFKLESVAEKQHSKWAESITGGFELTLVGINDMAHDLGLIAEFSYHSEGNSASPFAHDIILGSRYAFNDEADSEILWGFAQDLKENSSLLSIEASRRLNESIRLDIESRIFLDVDSVDPLYSLRDDDFIKVELIYYY